MAKLTKIQKSQVIVQALYNIDHFPSRNNSNVTDTAFGHKSDYLDELYEKALKILKKRKGGES